MKSLSLIVALATTVASSSVFGFPNTNSPPETYHLTGISGVSGTITMNTPSGNWSYPATPDPVLSYDIVDTLDNVTFSSSISGNSILLVAGDSITWNPTAITSIELGVVTLDPWSFDFNGLGGFDIYGDANGLADLGSTPLRSGPINLPEEVPDACDTWLLLAGVCGVFGAWQYLNRSMKIGNHS